jgi:hypothetical protein
MSLLLDVVTCGELVWRLVPLAPGIATCIAQRTEMSYVMYPTQDVT